MAVEQMRLPACVSGGITTADALDLMVRRPYRSGRLANFEAHRVGADSRAFMTEVSTRPNPSRALLWRRFLQVL